MGKKLQCYLKLNPIIIKAWLYLRVKHSSVTELWWPILETACFIMVFGTLD
uniref:Uncharacterized protein n=1 Tax=Helianthus annuus TaxID=4232 RepID=A0A251UU37_HELAN